MTAARAIDHTHDPALRSWVESANAPDTDFPIQNLPFGVFAPGAQGEGEGEGEGAGRIGIAIGDRILDVAAALDAGAFTGAAREAAGLCRGGTLNALFAAGRPAARALRAGASAFLAADRTDAAHAHARADGVLVRMADVEPRLPVAIGDYTDFYASIYHATHVGKLFRPDNPLLPNYKHIPIGYHGRASSIRVSDTPVRRPNGQTRPPDATAPTFGPTGALDYEAEMGFVVGPGNALGEPIPIGHAEDHLAGVCLVNDWSARDIQTWEYQPLGPFLAKSFGTTISPWVVSFDALTPFRAPAFARPASDPVPLPYLRSDADARVGAIDIVLEVSLRSRQMRDAELPPVRLSRGRLTDLYWTPAQMVAHHTSNGCDLRPGDLLASGTVSGPTPDSLGCLLELTARGTRPFMLPNGEQRAFLEDGDEVTLRARCERAGAVAIGFGICRATVLPARTGAGSSAPLPGAAISP